MLSSRQASADNAFLFPELSNSLTLVSVEAVLDGKVSLPCDIEPSDKTSDRVNMVLWFRDASGKPIYTGCFNRKATHDLLQPHPYLAYPDLKLTI
ncbi:Hemicentin-2 [Frankliniella fusca]|uniref:Hemicentin-2 n=1 Tax=Frankliniella fusca TaxID=407009 RepID=A0AAE1HSX4_9NEOP|nr:Hemicentin-2 [Frankliniella fusca]